MRENVYLFMGIAGYILVFIVVAMAIIDWCCYNILSEVSAIQFIIIIVMVLSAVVLIRVAHERL